MLVQVGFAEVLQLADIGLTGLATDPEIYAEAVQKQLILITKDTDFIRDVRYAIGHSGIVYVTQSKSELSDTVHGIVSLSQQLPTLTNMRLMILVGGQIQAIP
jgi:predicted nuclease of predicted toxin-antitoxin system